MKDKKPDWTYWIVLWSLLGVSFSTMMLLLKPFLIVYMPFFKLLSTFAVATESVPVLYLIGIVHASVIVVFIAFIPFMIANKILDYIYPKPKDV